MPKNEQRSRSSVTVSGGLVQRTLGSQEVRSLVLLSQKVAEQRLQRSGSLIPGPAIVFPLKSFKLHPSYQRCNNRGFDTTFLRFAWTIYANRTACVGSHLAGQLALHKVGSERRLRSISRLSRMTRAWRLAPPR
jgi:hypothetical protein